MFSPVYQGNVIIDNTLNAYFDFGDPACFLPSQGTGSITSGTPFFNLAPDYQTTTGSINGLGVNWSPAFGGCINLTNRNSSWLGYTAGFSASFTTQIVVTSTTDANPSQSFNNDAGGYPGYRPATDGMVLASQFSSNRNFLVPVLWAGSSGQTLALDVPPPGWESYTYFPSVITFRTNGSNSHQTLLNTLTTVTASVSTTRNRGNSPVGTIYLNRDTAVGDRHGIGRIVGYLHYNRRLSDGEVWQNAQYFLNRVNTK